MNEVLTLAEMAEADRLAGADAGSYKLMLNAGAAVAAEVLRRHPGAARLHVLCGPGNNGGDGYVVARILAESGCLVSVWREGVPKPGGDAERAAAECPVEARPLSEFAPEAGSVVVDALYGAGLSCPLSEASVAARGKAAGLPVIAIDLPSGLSGLTGRPTGPECFRADLTVTFVRKKPGHLLQPGRRHCGAIVVAEIGISDAIVGSLGVECFENGPALWLRDLPSPDISAHKYSRGHVGVFSGGASATGAARLSAMAAARAGAGAVTVLSPADAMAANAAHLTSIMLRQVDGLSDLAAFRRSRSGGAFVLGPGFGVGQRARDFALALLHDAAGIVLDADAITSFASEPGTLFAAAGGGGAPTIVLTPHEGEFRRLFPDLADESVSKLDRARSAADRSHMVLIYKGPDTVIAAPDSRAAINTNGTPWLATAGSGDVLAGIVAGLLAQGMPAFEASCAAVWLHAEAGRRFGPGLIAQDLPAALPQIMRELLGYQVSFHDADSASAMSSSTEKAKELPLPRPGLASTDPGVR